MSVQKLTEAAKYFRHDRIGGNAFNSRHSRVTYLALLQTRIGMRTMLASIDDNMVAKLVALRHADGVTPSTVNRSMTELLRAILGRAKLWKQIVQPIGWKMHKLKEPEGIVREVSAGEEARAIAHF